MGIYPMTTDFGQFYSLKLILDLISRHGQYKKDGNIQLEISFEHSSSKYEQKNKTPSGGSELISLMER